MERKADQAIAPPGKGWGETRGERIAAFAGGNSAPWLFSIHVARSDHIAEEVHKKSVNNQQGKRLLIIDGDAAMLRLLKHIFTHAGCQVQVATFVNLHLTGGSAFKKADFAGKMILGKLAE